MTSSLAKKLFSKTVIGDERRSIDRTLTNQFVNNVLEILYPQMSKNCIRDATHLDLYIKKCQLHLFQMLSPVVDVKRADELVTLFFKELENISDLLDWDAAAIFKGDPAAQSIEEIFFCYPGFFAIASHRVAHFFYQQKISLLPRMLSEYAHQITGVDIHPGASIGKYFCIDHGTGIVIGETAEIGDNVKIYQGVTLGALSVEKKNANRKRHPTIKNNCVIYSNATLLGGETIIEENCIIGGNVWLTKSIPANSIVYHKSQVKLTSQIKKAN